MRPKNGRVLGTPEERKRIGEELQRLRNEQHWNQDDIAEKANMSIGSVQAIEYNKWDVGIPKIERYAALFGTTADRLLYPPAMQPVDPKWQGLNDEHLTIARQYALALKVKRTAVEVILVDDLAGTGISTELAEIVLALHEDPKWLQLWTDVVECLEADAKFERALREVIDTTKSLIDPPKLK